MVVNRDGLVAKNRISFEEINDCDGVRDCDGR